MAERRMFAKTIIDSDMFLDLPLSTQALYFHLSMRADDEGFINNPKKIMRMVGASQNEFEMLLAKRFILSFDSGVIVIKHWKMHNYIQKDRRKPTVYHEEAAQLVTKKNKAYSFAREEIIDCTQDVSKVDTDRTQDGYSLDRQIRLGKDSIGEYRADGHGKKEPHFQLANEWYKRHNSEIATLVSPSEKDYKKSHELLQRVDLDTARKAIELYFTVQDWPQWDAKKGKWNYNFASFCANIETILSQQPEKEDTFDVFTDDDVLGIEAENF